MKNSIYFLLLCVCFVSSCYNYDVQYEGPIPQLTGVDTITLPYTLVYVSGGRVFLNGDFGEIPLELEGVTSAEIASINNNHTKVLYKETGQDIQVYDIKSKQVETVPNTSTAIHFDYHFNNETIYCLMSNGILKTIGPKVFSWDELDLGAHSAFPITVDGVGGAVIIEGNRILYQVSLASGQGSALVLSDGVSRLRYEFTTPQFNHLRTNHSGNRVTAFNGSSTDKILINSLEYESFLQSPYLKLPHSSISDDAGDEGYGVIRSFSGTYFVEIPDRDNVELPFNNVTSLDY